MASTVLFALFAAASPRLSMAEAVQTTLDRHPAIRTAEQDAALLEGARTVTSGRFDHFLTAAIAHTHDVSELPESFRFSSEERTITDEISFSVGATRRFRWGMSVTPSVRLRRVHSRQQPLPTFDPQFPITFDAQNRAEVTLTVLQSLLRGLGTVGTAAQEAAAKKAYQASLHDLAQARGLRVLMTATAYWNHAAARSTATILAASVTLASKQYDDTEQLVKAEQRPPADLGQLRALMAERRRNVLLAERAVFGTQQSLGLAMGLQTEEAIQLPAPHAPTSRNTLVADLDASVARRQDVVAAGLRVEAARALMESADWNTLPNLDLALSLGYSGFAERGGGADYFRALGRGIGGLNGSASLSLELPFENREREGALLQARATHRRAVVAKANLERNVRSRIAVALNDLRLTSNAADEAKLAVADYQQAAENERTKMRAGLATVIDVIVTQDRLIAAQLAQVDAETARAIALARLAFETGRLPDELGALTGEANAE